MQNHKPYQCLFYACRGGYPCAEPIRKKKPPIEGSTGCTQSPDLNLAVPCRSSAQACIIAALLTDLDSGKMAKLDTYVKVLVCGSCCDALDKSSIK